MTFRLGIVLASSAIAASAIAAQSILSSDSRALSPFYAITLMPGRVEPIISYPNGWLVQGFLSKTDCPTTSANLTINTRGELQLSGTNKCLTADRDQALITIECGAIRTKPPKFQITSDGQLVETSMKYCIVNRNGTLGLEDVTKNGNSSCVVITAVNVSSTGFQMTQPMKEFPFNVKCSRVDHNKLVEALPTECPPPSRASKLVVNKEGKLQNFVSGLCYEVQYPSLYGHKLLIQTACKNTTSKFAVRKGVLTSLTPNTCLKNLGGPYGLQDLPAGAKSCVGVVPEIRVATGCL